MHGIIHDRGDIRLPVALHFADINLALTYQTVNDCRVANGTSNDGTTSAIVSSWPRCSKTSLPSHVEGRARIEAGRRFLAKEGHGTFRASHPAEIFSKVVDDA